MEFPDESMIDPIVGSPPLPKFAKVSYEPRTPELDNVKEETSSEMATLPLDRLSEGDTVAVGLGSRGIHDILPVAQTVVADLAERGFDRKVVPAMGSHGGATAEGQRETLAALGMTEETLGCSVDARMETVTLGTSDVGHEVEFSKAALEADGIMIINRIKPHTNFFGRIESGLCKMLTVGLGKQEGAQKTHESALVNGYVETIEGACDVIDDNTPFLGGVAIVENFYERTAVIEAIPAENLPDAETPLLKKAREYMPTLPYEEIDVLVVEEIGKDISGAGMDTNVTGRYQVLNTDDPEIPVIKRIVVCGLTDATHGNGMGIGAADLTTKAVAKELDLEQMYTNALTSSSLSKTRIPMILPSQEHTVRTAVSTIGSYDPEEARIVWIEDTSHLSSFRVSESLAEEERDAVEIERWERLSFSDGEPIFQADTKES